MCHSNTCCTLLLLLLALAGCTGGPRPITHNPLCPHSDVEMARRASGRTDPRNRSTAVIIAPSRTPVKVAPQPTLPSGNSGLSDTKLASSSAAETGHQHSAKSVQLVAAELPPEAEKPELAVLADDAIPIQSAANEVSLDLSSALAMVGGNHPAVGLAQWRTQEAYAQLQRAEVLWLPSIQAGFSFNRHDGNLQNSNGAIVDANRSSFQYGLGAGAVGAGTTTRPGLVAQFHLADAFFQPEIAGQVASARSHGANAVMNQQLLNVALAYQELLGAVQEERVLEESRERIRSLFKLTNDYAVTGQGLQADADRLQTEVQLVESRLLGTQERKAIASARLAQQISLQSRQTINPAEPVLMPLELANADLDEAILISTGLSSRPELAESQALVAAAISQHDRQRVAPFVPSVLLGFSSGGFGGGIGQTINNVNGRYDLDAAMTWEIRNLGLGEQAARREARTRIEQARYEQVRLLDQVAREITEAAVQVQFRSERIQVAEQAIQSATLSYDRNLTRIRDGQGLPIEVLQSIRALEDAQREYVTSIVAYNQAQFQLQWAQGWPVQRLPQSTAAFN